MREARQKETYLGGRGRQALRALPLALWLTFTFTVFAPVVLAAGSPEEFWFTVGQMLPGVWPVFAASAILAWAVLTALPSKAWRIAAAALLAAGLMSLAQGNGLNADYGSLDGKAMDWSAYTVYAILNTLEWAAAILVCITFRETRGMHLAVVLLPCMLLAGEIAWCAADVLQAPQTKAAGELQLTTDGLNTVGDGHNVILLILDSVDASDMEDALAADPSLAEELDGFTFYENAMGLSDPTKFGIPAILTGRVWDTSTDYAGFIDAAYADAGLFELLAQGGWDARVYTDSRYVAVNEVTLENARPLTVTVSDAAAMNRDLLQLCAFRYAPHLLKPAFWMYSNVFGRYAHTEEGEVYSENDPAYAASLSTNGLTSVSGNAFRAIHLVGMHPPYTMNAACEYVVEGVDASEQRTGCMRMVTTYLRELKRLNVYDSADVLILADHGTEEVHRPMLLCKRGGQAGALTVSDAAVSYADLAATYAAMLTGEESGGELWNISGSRTRLYYHEASRNNEFNYYEYATAAEDPAWEDLTKTGVVYHGDTSGAETPYTLGTTLYFDLRATARRYLVSGFSSADFMSTWTNGAAGQMTLPLAALPVEDHVTVALSFLSVMGGAQRLQVTCAGETVFDDVVTERSVCFAVPAALMAEGTLTLDFTYPDALSHKDAGLSEDTRQVAFALTEMVVRDGD